MIYNERETRFGYFYMSLIILIVLMVTVGICVNMSLWDDDIITIMNCIIYLHAFILLYQVIMIKKRWNK